MFHLADRIVTFVEDHLPWFDRAKEERLDAEIEAERQAAIHARIEAEGARRDARRSLDSYRRAIKRM